MLKVVISLRIKQGIRYMTELGLIRILLLLALILYVTANLLAIIIDPASEQLTYMVAGIIVLSVIGIHFQRTDRRFLKVIQLQSNYLFSIEYLAFVFPFALAYMGAYWYISLALLLSAVLIAQINIRVGLSRLRTISLPFISATAFEWKSSIRKQFPNLLVMYLLGLGFMGIHVVPPVFVLIITLICCFFYNEAEPREMIEVFDKSPAKFIIEKTRVCFWNFIKLMFPLFLCYFIINYSYWYFMVYTLVASAFLLFFAILLKYAVYEPHKSLSFNGMLIGLATFSFIVPFLAPVPIIMTVIYYRKAIRNMQQWL